MSLDVGQRAPSFQIYVDENKRINLEDYKGKKLLLYFYPKDDTPGCTIESCGFRDHYEEIKSLGAEILGISQDDLKSHQKFKQKYQLPFDLGADEDGTVCALFGVLKEKSILGFTSKRIERSTFLIDEQGLITHFWPSVSIGGHLKEVLAALRE